MAGKRFGPLHVEVNTNADHVVIEDADLGWKYGVPVYEQPAAVAKHLRKIADWLESIDTGE